MIRFVSIGVVGFLFILATIALLRTQLETKRRRERRVKRDRSWAQKSMARYREEVRRARQRGDHRAERAASISLQALAGEMRRLQTPREPLIGGAMIVVAAAAYNLALVLIAITGQASFSGRVLIWLFLAVNLLFLGTVLIARQFERREE